MNVLFIKEALADLDEIDRYITRENPQAAKRVITAIRRSTDRLALFP